MTHATPTPTPHNPQQILPITQTLLTPQQIRTQFRALREQGLRARDAAQQLGISEGQALCAHAVNLMKPMEEEQSLYSVCVLDSRWVELLQGLEGVGPVMALTRNEFVVHEKIGVYRNVSTQGPVGMALGPEIDLRLFFRQWYVGIHVVEHDAKRGDQHSLQFFDAHGQAIHKVHARANSDLQALETLAQAHTRLESPPLFMPPQQTPKAPAALYDDVSCVDVAGLGEAWSAMKDTHEFFELIKRFGVSRVNSLRLMEGRHTLRTPVHAAEVLLHQSASSGLPIMVFAGNGGCLQIHTGAVHRIESIGNWLNVLDDGFNLHLRADQIAESWLVSKPTVDGVVTSVELFDATGELMCMFFGERKPGRPELPAWRELAHRLPTLPHDRQAVHATSQVAA